MPLLSAAAASRRAPLSAADEVENPCVINTQAVSASFLRDPKDAGKRYTFFLKAANLEPLKLDYRQGYVGHIHLT